MGAVVQAVKKLFAPAPATYGGTDVDLVTGTETSPNIVQSETYTMGNPDNPLQILSAYNDSRGRNASPINISGASYSTDGGTTFVRLTGGTGQSPFLGTEGDPVALYNKPTSTWFTVWLDTACGGQGLGGYKSSTPTDPLRLAGPTFAFSASQYVGNVCDSGLIQNGGFETGTFTPGWTIDGTLNPPVVTNANPHSGTFSALAGSTSGAEPLGDSSFYQQFAVPAGSSTLSFWHWDFTTDSITFDWQDAYITDSSGTILATIFHQCLNGNAWINQQVDMAPYAGQTVRIKFLVHQDGFGDDTAMYVDDVGLFASCLAPVPSSAVSRMVHGAAGPFDINLPLVPIGGAVGIEDRTGVAGVYQEVITFATNVTVASVSVTSGTGSATLNVTGAVVTVNLTGVTNAQRLGVTLNNVNDGTHTGNVLIAMGVLAGDTNASGAVRAADVAQTKAQSGSTTTAANFREDVNASGSINAGDVALVKSKAGTTLPP